LKAILQMFSVLSSAAEADLLFYHEVVSFGWVSNGRTKFPHLAAGWCQAGP
jgi:hypothetical protein